MKALLTVDRHVTIYLSSEVGPSFNELRLLRLPLAGLLVPMLAGPARPFHVMSYSTKNSFPVLLSVCFCLHGAAAFWRSYAARADDSLASQKDACLVPV